MSERIERRDRAMSIFSMVMVVLMTILAVFFLVRAASSPVPGLAIFLGLAFMALALGALLMHFHNATGGPEPESVPPDMADRAADGTTAVDRTCQACGYGLLSDFAYCPKCGRRA